MISLLSLTDSHLERIQVVWDRQDLHQAMLNQQQLKFHFVRHPDTNVTKFSSLYLACLLKTSVTDLCSEDNCVLNTPTTELIVLYVGLSEVTQASHLNLLYHSRHSILIFALKV